MTRRALLYLRQSDSEGAGERSLSIDSQASVLHADATRNHWAVIEEIRDADEKGWDDKRPGLLRLYERCRAGDVDVVAVWSLSRLARSLRIQEQVFDELARLGVEVWSHEEPDVNRPLFRQILGAFNEEQTRVISAHTRRALQERHTRGLVHGYVLFGYQHVEHRLVIDDERAAIVRRVFELRANGASWSDIGRELAQNGIDTPRGKGEWRKQSLAAMVTNTTYRGERQFGGTGRLQPCPAIVSPELWERAQRKDEYRTRAPRATQRTRSWLEGLVIHGCGQPMYLQPRRDRQWRFRCAVNTSGTFIKACSVRPMSIIASHMEQEAWQILADDLTALRSVPLRSLVADARRRFRAASPGSEAVAAVAAQQLQRATDRRQRAEDLYLGGLRDRTWFAAEDARIGEEVAAANLTLASLPQLPDPDAIERIWTELRAMALQIPHVDASSARAMTLRRLGVVRMNADGLSIQYRRDIADILDFWRR